MRLRISVIAALVLVGLPAAAQHRGEDVTAPSEGARLHLPAIIGLGALTVAGFVGGGVLVHYADVNIDAVRRGRSGTMAQARALELEGRIRLQQGFGYAGITLGAIGAFGLVVVLAVDLTRPRGGGAAEAPRVPEMRVGGQPLPGGGMLTVDGSF